MLFGYDAKLYRLTTGTRATWHATIDGNGFHVGPAPSNLDEVPNVKDIAVPISKDTVDVSTRANNKWKATAATLRDTEIPVPMVYDSADADMLAFMKAFNLDTNIAVAILDGPKATVGTLGIWMDAQVTKMEKSENLGEAQMITFTLKPALGAVGPEMVKVSA